jgi:hypothetical protein
MIFTQGPQKQYKDRLFKAIFGRDTEESKRWRLDLYNALNGTDYKDPNAIKVNTIENHSEGLQKKCNALYDYSKFIGKVRRNKKAGMEVQDAVDKAVDEAIEENLLDGFFTRQKAEVVGMILEEFNEERFKRNMREEGYEDGAYDKAIETAKNLLRMNLGTIEQITQATSLPLGKVREIAQGISAESLSVHS